MNACWRILCLCSSGVTLSNRERMCPAKCNLSVHFYSSLLTKPLLTGRIRSRSTRQGIAYNRACCLRVFKEISFTSHECLSPFLVQEDRDNSTNNDNKDRESRNIINCLVALLVRETALWFVGWWYQRIGGACPSHGELIVNYLQAERIYSEALIR